VKRLISLLTIVAVLVAMAAVMPAPAFAGSVTLVEEEMIIKYTEPPPKETLEDSGPFRCC
jgi:hypothetical protein